MHSIPQAEKGQAGQYGFPRWPLTAAIAFSLLAIAVAGQLSWQLNHDLDNLQEKATRLDEYVSQVTLFDEVLTMSARMAVATGDVSYEKRYDRYAAQLETLIATTASGLGVPEVRQFVDQTQEANVKLVEMERRAFALASEGQRTEASALLVSDEYERWKSVYAKGLERTAAWQKGLVDSARRRLDSQTVAFEISGAAVILLLLSTWFLVFRAGRRRGQERLRWEEALRKGHDELELRVRQRTAELQAANEALRDNITNREVAEETLRVSEERLQTIFNSVSDGIFVTDASTGKFIDVNPAGCFMFGYSRGELIGSDIVALSSGVAPYDQVRAIEWVGRAGAEGPQTFEWHSKAKDGRLFWTEIVVRYATYGGRSVVLATLRDITMRKQAQELIVQMAGHDALTGLPNRRVFIDAVRQAIARAERGDKGFAVLYLDLDHFKDVNDTLGHPAGDMLLCAVADRLRSIARDTDLVARFGGDEFAVIAAVLDEPADAATLAEKLVAGIGSPFSIQGNEVRTGVSIGIAVYEPGDTDPETLLSQADVALYQAKSDGRSGYRFFTDSMEKEVRDRVTLTAELREAIASRQFFLEYQPQIDAQTGSIIGVESLVRWRHPTRGVLSPSEFIPVAERTNLIVALDRWVKREACRQAKAWVDAGLKPLPMSVNVSGVQFKRAMALEKDVAIVLRDSGLPAQMLELELTETVLMEASQEQNDVLVRLRESGIKLAIDDFGTGYSSLDYLRRFPVDRVKIAQVFVERIVSEPSSAAIVRATITLARELGMVTIAEGVETVEQFELLKGWGCAQMQGYYFARPLAPADFALLINGNRTFGSTALVTKTAA